MRAGRLLLWLCIISVLVVLAIPLLTYQLVLDERPMVLASPSLNGADLVGLQRLLSRQRAQEAPDGRITVKLGQTDIDTAIKYALQTSAPDFLEGVVVTLQQDQASVAGCLTLPTALQRRYLNVRAVLAPHDLTLGVQQLQLGVVTLPGAVVRWLEKTALRKLYTNDQIPGLQSALAALESIEVDGARLAVTYHDRVDPVGEPGQGAPALADLPPELVNTYIAALRALTAKTNSRRYPMVGLLSPLFEFAAQRSSSEGAHAATENAAAIVAFAQYAGEPRLLHLAGLTGRFDSPGRALALTVHQRYDLAKHFINSALIYLLAGNQIAEFVGLQKELDDDDHGSGFSLADLVADKAGIRFAELATSSNRSALSLQSDVAALLYDDQIMPHPSTLPAVQSSAQLDRMSERDSNRYLHDINRQVQPLLVPIALYRYERP